jgi:NAD(P)-dependent dehydrogenase (short-subunit alcohol dehydrogenase family)
MSLYDLDGSVALVTGGARGIGRAISVRLAREGADVAIADLDDADPVVAEIEALGRRAIGIRADVSQRTDVERLMAGIISRFGRIDILVNNAGILRVTPILDIDETEWDLHMAVNAKAPLLCSQAAARAMIAQGGGGRIIVIVSSAGRLPSAATIGSYVASKHAAMGLVQQMGRELAPRGILVNAVLPGIVDTPMLETVHRGMAARTGRTQADLLAADEAAIPVGRLQLPEDVANMVAFLASREANYSAGQAFDVSGGAFFW